MQEQLSDFHYLNWSLGLMSQVDSEKKTLVTAVAVESDLFEQRDHLHLLQEVGNMAHCFVILTIAWDQLGMLELLQEVLDPQNCQLHSLHLKKVRQKQFCFILIFNCACFMKKQWNLWHKTLLYLATSTLASNKDKTTNGTF